jgi:hypothetical protein
VFQQICLACIPGSGLLLSSEFHFTALHSKKSRGQVRVVVGCDDVGFQQSLSDRKSCAGGERS